jgi:hypothetical protein
VRLSLFQPGKQSINKALFFRLHVTFLCHTVE